MSNGCVNSETEYLNKLALKAGGCYVFSSIMLRAISMLTTPIFTRLMSTEEYGVTSTFDSWVSLLTVFCTLNLTYSIGRAKLDYLGKLDEYIGAMQLLSLLLSGILSTVLIMFCRPLSGVMEIPVIALPLLALQLISNPIIEFYQNGTRYRYKYKENIAIGWYSSIANIALSLFLVLSINADKAILRIIGGVIPSLVLAMFLLSKSIRNGSLRYNAQYWKYGITLSTPLVLHEISHSILSQSDRIFISRICGASDTGIYSIAYNYGCLMSVVTGAIANGWLPWFHDKYYAKEFNEIRKNSKYIVVLGCYIGLACIDLAPEAVAVLGGSEYAKGMYCIAPVTLGIVCQYVYTHYVNIEMHLKKTKFVPVGTIIAAVINLVLNAVFIPRFGFIAASYTTFASYFVLMLIHYFFSKWILKVSLYDDEFMFGSVLITSLISVVLIWSYKHTVIRYVMLIIGFISFLYIYRSYIIGWTKKRKK